MNDQLASELASLRIDPTNRRVGSFPWRTLLALLVLGGAALAAGPAYSAIAPTLFKPEVQVTEIVQLAPAAGAVDLTATGYVVPLVVAKVGSKVTGRITKAELREGDVVKAGQVLFELDPRDERSQLATAGARVASARARVETARANLDELHVQLARESKLVESGASTRSKVEDLEARKKVLERLVNAASAEQSALGAEASAITRTLDNFVIKAPIDGTVTTRPAVLGDVATPQLVLVELADFKSLVVEVDVPESRLALVKPKSPCEVLLDAAPNDRLRGEVLEVAPKLNRSKATAVVRVRVLNPPERYFPEMAARVSFLSKALDEQALKAKPKRIIPGAAIVERNGLKMVYVLDAGRVRLTEVKLGPVAGTGFELVDGPPAGTKLVATPAPDLADGALVKEPSR